jgi:hypothetical protein
VPDGDTDTFEPMVRGCTVPYELLNEALFGNHDEAHGDARLTQCLERAFGGPHGGDHKTEDVLIPPVCGDASEGALKLTNVAWADGLVAGFALYQNAQRLPEGRKDPVANEIDSAIAVPTDTQ